MNASDAFEDILPELLNSATLPAEETEDMIRISVNYLRWHQISEANGAELADYLLQAENYSSEYDKVEPLIDRAKSHLLP